MRKNFIYFVAAVARALIVRLSTPHALAPLRLVPKAFTHRLVKI